MREHGLGIAAQPLHRDPDHRDARGEQRSVLLGVGGTHGGIRVVDAVDLDRQQRTVGELDQHVDRSATARRPDQHLSADAYETGTMQQVHDVHLRQRVGAGVGRRQRVADGGRVPP